MKTISLLFSICLSSFVGLGQTITSVANGNSTNPLTWDCNCFPTSGSNIIIAHDVLLNTDWLISSGGSITVNSGASLVQSGNRSILINGNNAEYNNNGTTTLTNLSTINEGALYNNDVIELDSGLYIGLGSVFNNTSQAIDIDSILNEGTLINTGILASGDVFNTGVFENNGEFSTDSLYNAGVFSSFSGALTASAVATIGDFILSGTSSLITTTNFLNSGKLEVSLGRTLRVGNDFATNDSINGTANVINNGLIEIGNNFFNGDTIQGSGIFCILNSSSNSGDVIGTLDICDNTLSGSSAYFDFDIGIIASGVTSCVSNCSVGIKSFNVNTFKIYPNPSNDFVNLDVPDGEIIQIYNQLGILVSTKRYTSQIDITDLSTGLYHIKVTDLKGTIFRSQLIKNNN